MEKAREKKGKVKIFLGVTFSILWNNFRAMLNFQMFLLKKAWLIKISGL